MILGSVKKLLKLRFQIQLIIILTVVFNFTLISSASCSPYSNTVLEAAEEVKIARQRLLALPVSDQMIKISPLTLSSISQMKESIEKLVVTYLDRISIDTVPDMDRIKSELNDLIQLKKYTSDENITNDLESIRFAYETSFEVKITPDKRKLLQVKSTFSIPCGRDSMLFIFEPNKEEKRWTKVFNWQSGDYKETYKALNVFQYEISSPDSDGKWYVLGADNPTHCNSCWGKLRYYILRPVVGSTKPIISFKDWTSLYDCNDAEWDSSLIANPTSFEVRFPDHALQPEILIRQHIRHYELRNGQFERTQPVANTPADFVDEWITSPWNEALQWCKEKGCNKLKTTHKRLQKASTEGGYFQLDNISHNPSTDFVKVTLWVDGKQRNHPPLHFWIKQESHIFILMNIEPRLIKDVLRKVSDTFSPFVSCLSTDEFLQSTRHRKKEHFT